MATTKINYEPDWAGRLKRRTFAKFQGKPNMEAIRALLASLAQDQEDAAQSLLGLPDLDDGEGIVLDGIGRILQEPRNGDGDDDYRPRLKARRAADKSTGNPASIYAVFFALLNDTEPLITMERYRIAAYVVRLFEQVTAGFAAVALRMMGAATSAGVNDQLVWIENDPGEIFQFGYGSFLDGASLAAAGTLTVLSTALFPQEGQFSLRLERDQANEETVLAQVLDGTTLTMIGTLAHPHPDRTDAFLVGGRGGYSSNHTSTDPNAGFWSFVRKGG